MFVFYLSALSNGVYRTLRGRLLLSTMCSNPQMRSEEEQIIVKKSTDPNAPMILLFGWAGCRDRYLSKYSQIYESKNFSVVRFTVPIMRVNCYASYRQFAFEVYDKVFNMGADELKIPVFFHLFSMNGCSLFSSLWDFLGDTATNGDTVKKALKGVIFDSCPANVMPWQGADAVSFASLPPSKYSSVQRAGYRYLLTGIFSVHRALIWMRSHFERNIYEQHFSYFHLLKCTDLPQRQLYLYSRADTICSHASIEDFQRRQLEVNPQVELAKVCWEDSSHVEHLRKYATEYTAACTRFVEGADVATISSSSGTSDPTTDDSSASHKVIVNGVATTKKSDNKVEAKLADKSPLRSNGAVKSAESINNNCECSSA